MWKMRNTHPMNMKQVATAHDRCLGFVWAGIELSMSWHMQLPFCPWLENDISLIIGIWLIRVIRVWINHEYISLIITNSNRITISQITIPNSLQFLKILQEHKTPKSRNLFQFSMKFENSCWSNLYSSHAWTVLAIQLQRSINSQLSKFGSSMAFENLVH
jgi:hypothetical protein